MDNIVCLIPARGGSKGIPGKNIADVGGKPLVAWSVLQGLGSPSLNKQVYVTSDSSEILQVAERFGGRTIRRPDDLSGDKASSESALVHALGEIAHLDERPIDWVVFLQPTSPVRKPGDIENAIQTVKREKADSLLSVQPLKDYFIWGHDSSGQVVSKSFDYRQRKRRQDLEPTYLENGSIYIFRPDILLKGGNRLGGKIALYEMDKIHSQQIDEPEDLDLCGYFLRRHYG